MPAIFFDPDSKIGQYGEFKIPTGVLKNTWKVICEPRMIEVSKDHFQIVSAALANRSLTQPILRTTVKGNIVTVSFVFTDSEAKSRTIVWTFKRSRKGLLYLKKYVLYYHNGTGFIPVNILFKNGSLCGCNILCIKPIRFNPKYGMNDNQALKLCANCIRVQALNSFLENVTDQSLVSYIRSKLFELTVLM